LGERGDATEGLGGAWRVGEREEARVVLTSSGSFVIAAGEEGVEFERGVGVGWSGRVEFEADTWVFQFPSTPFDIVGIVTARVGVSTPCAGRG
jgi:hypothetical protein